MLKHKVETMVTVDAFDLDRLATEVYGHEFSFAAAQELGNDTSHELTIPSPHGLTWHPDKENDERWKRWLDEGYYDYGTAQQILEDLYSRGLAPAGNYVIQVSW